jgi:hypothetical protein
MQAYVQEHQLEKHLSQAVNEAVRAGSEQPLLFLADALARIAAAESANAPDAEGPGRSALNRRGSFGTNGPPLPPHALVKQKSKRRSSFSDQVADHTLENAKQSDFASLARRDSTNEAAALAAAAAAAARREIEGVGEEEDEAECSGGGGAAKR